MSKKMSILAAALLLLCSCNSKKAADVLMPDATGAPYDLYIVMPDDLKETALNDSLKEIFEYPMEGTPNGDEYFYVSTLKPDHFVRSVRTLANVILVDIDPEYRGAPVKMSRNKYANGQIILKMKGQSVEQLANTLMPMQEQLREIFVKNELKRGQKNIKANNNIEQEDRLMKMQNVSMSIPFALKKKGKGESDANFFWTTDDFAEKQSHIVVYSVPYTSQDIFTLEGAVAIRDSVMKANIPGGFPDSYMETNKRVVLPEYKALNVGGKYVGELRGMWRIVNGLMAGPFVCHIRLDEENQRVVFAEGFVYAPHDGKRKLIRNLEAALYTLHLPSDNMMSEIEFIFDSETVVDESE